MAKEESNDKKCAKTSEIKFFCSKCGACCQQLELFGKAYEWLDKGDGVCRYFDVESKLCTIYETRPLICRVEEGYHAFFADRSYEEYIKATHLACEKLQLSLKLKTEGKLS